MRLIECVPNFSEGRDTRTLQEICDAISAVDQAFIIDVHSDKDHNRTVVTVVGDPDCVANAVFEGAVVAAERINLEVHRGVHPRIGAMDVAPFVPLRNVGMETCVGLARAFGERIGSELDIPVYLYACAATNKERQNLAYVRRLQYEALQTAIVDDSSFSPDYGPRRLTPAGAAAIGARVPLIAYNVYLDSDDITVAKSIATSIRESSGGMRDVKALGFMVKGRAQVSMNILDFRVTSIYAVLERVRQLAAVLDVSVFEFEVVGLAPQAAFANANAQIAESGVDPRQHMLEQRIGEITGDFEELTFE